MRWLTPARRRGVEILDDAATPAEARRRAMRDVARSNALFGGTRAVIRALDGVAATLPADVALLDVGTGLADLPAALRKAALRRGMAIRVVGLDAAPDLLVDARQHLDAAASGDARRLPLRTGSMDVVVCSQVLHHFAMDDARAALAELHRVARGSVIVSDLRRSWVAAAGFWIASVLLGFDAITRHDGVVSVLRGFTAAELERLVRATTGVQPTVRRAPFWRLTATWSVRAG